jgi:hypothetical protein
VHPRYRRLRVSRSSLYYIPTIPHADHFDESRDAVHSALHPIPRSGRDARRHAQDRTGSCLAERVLLAGGVLCTIRVCTIRTSRIIRTRMVKQYQRISTHENRNVYSDCHGSTTTVIDPKFHRCFHSLLSYWPVGVVYDSLVPEPADMTRVLSSDPLRGQISGCPKSVLDCDRYSDHFCGRYRIWQLMRRSDPVIPSCAFYRAILPVSDVIQMGSHQNDQ